MLASKLTKSNETREKLPKRLSYEKGAHKKVDEIETWAQFHQHST